ncbi:hypothetical protein Sant_3582 [Sodalis praecaptivus]|uniref:Uncharacterized protein n=1 Tax=Sodalis praecaptivus TaxID=1239307 RepID=W0HXS8_9GAMM|nr:hypothetical protein Sant_3582 [Sodalis praecaptivus]
MTRLPIGMSLTMPGGHLRQTASSAPTPFRFVVSAVSAAHACRTPGGDSPGFTGGTGCCAALTASFLWPGVDVIHRPWSRVAST